jgi:hypothetical protein
MKAAIVALLFIHGAVHLLGFAKAFGLLALPRLKVTITRSRGLVWLVAGLSMWASDTLFASSVPSWSGVAVLALVLSQAAIVSAWSDAKFGTIANAIILLAVALAFLTRSVAGMREVYQPAGTRWPEHGTQAAVVTEADRPWTPFLVGAFSRPR